MRDSGLVHVLLTIGDAMELLAHPKLGASWEGFVIEQILAAGGSANAYFWKTHAGAELDLLLLRDGRAVGYEIKHADAPRTTKSMRIALRDLDLHHLFVVYPGPKTYPLDTQITCLSIYDLVGHTLPR